MEVNGALNSYTIPELGKAIGHLRDASETILGMAQNGLIAQDNPEAARELRRWWEEIFHHHDERAQAIIHLLATGEHKKKE